MTTNSQPPSKRARKVYNSNVTRERLDAYSYDIVHTREMSRSGGQTTETVRCQQKGKTTWQAPSSWASNLNLVDDSELGLGDVGDEEWEDFENEVADDGSGRPVPKGPKKARKPQVRLLFAQVPFAALIL